MTPSKSIGLAAIGSTYSALHIDREWGSETARGFCWWEHEYAQDVWSDPGLQDDDIVVYRLHARTELLRDFDPRPEHLDAIRPRVRCSPT